MTTDESDEDLTKVWVDLPNHWATGGESMWAAKVGPDLYEIRNVPFHAYGLNYCDVVRAVEREADQKPEILSLVKPGGHRTLRAIFKDHVPVADRGPLLAELKPLCASYENADDIQFAIDVEPDGDYAAVCDQLFQWEKSGLLEYETCEARIEGSFDDAPDEEVPA